MQTQGEPIVILLAEDDPAHAEIVRRNLEAAQVANHLVHVLDGLEALDYLYQRKQFSDPLLAPRPGLVLLDLRMPKVDGLEVLRTIKTDPALCGIPTVILTTSSAEIDIAKAYEYNANSYLVKPVHFEQFVELVQALGYYWLIWNRTATSG